MKAVRQARLELSGGSTPDQLKPRLFLLPSSRGRRPHTPCGTHVPTQAPMYPHSKAHMHCLLYLGWEIEIWECHPCLFCRV